MPKTSKIHKKQPIFGPMSRNSSSEEKYFGENSDNEQFLGKRYMRDKQGNKKEQCCQTACMITKPTMVNSDIEYSEQKNLLEGSSNIYPPDKLPDIHSKTYTSSEQQTECYDNLFNYSFFPPMYFPMYPIFHPFFQNIVHPYSMFHQGKENNQKANFCSKCGNEELIKTKETEKEHKEVQTCTKQATTSENIKRNRKKVMKLRNIVKSHRDRRPQIWTTKYLPYPPLNRLVKLKTSSSEESCSNIVENTISLGRDVESKYKMEEEETCQEQEHTVMDNQRRSRVLLTSDSGTKADVSDTNLYSKMPAPSDTQDNSRYFIPNSNSMLTTKNIHGDKNEKAIKKDLKQNTKSNEEIFKKKTEDKKNVKKFATNQNLTSKPDRLSTFFKF